MVGGELGRRMHREGRDRRYALLLIVGKPRHRPVREGPMTIRKPGRSVKDGHDRKRGVVGNSSELRNDRPGRQATAFQQLEGLRSRRSENGQGYPIQIGGLSRFS